MKDKKILYVEDDLSLIPCFIHDLQRAYDSGGQF